jgi:endonuclease-3 related protein
MKVLKQFYQALLGHFGPQRWWPGDTVFEIIVGAILTQNTSWSNVETALAQLKHQRCLTPAALHALPLPELASLIRPCGYHNIKAQRVRAFTDLLFHEYDGDLRVMAKEPIAVLRSNLLSVKGIGPETADAILLYAFHQPVFVVDAYTKRLLYRHGLIEVKATYDQIQQMFMAQLQTDSYVYNEYHALIVRLGKEHCRTKPDCTQCPLRTIHYSLRNRCSQCHRYLPKSLDRIFDTKRGITCSSC